MADNTRALVTDVRGNVFIVRGDKTHAVKVGTQIQDLDEIMTETSGLISFSDYYGHHYFLSGSGHIKIYNRMLEVKSGYVWLKNPKDQFEYSAQTANSVINYSGGEGVLSFDPYAGKTQFLNIQGEFEFGNILQKDIKTPVREGHFTYIDNKMGSGVPRRPTPIGYESYKKIVSLFQGLNPNDAKESNIIEQNIPRPVTKKQRSIASVPKATQKTSPVVSKEKMGTIKIIENNNHVKEDQEEAVSKYLNTKMNKMKTDIANRPWKPNYGKKSSVKVNVFGKRPKFLKKKVKTVNTQVYKSGKSKAQKQAYRPVKSSRAPASVNPFGYSKKNEKQDPFEKSLMENYKKQMRHSNEVNSLIQDLKNYRQDYQISY